MAFMSYRLKAWANPVICDEQEFATKREEGHSPASFAMPA
jgi:hypothetical protein